MYMICLFVICVGWWNKDRTTFLLSLSFLSEKKEKKRRSFFDRLQ